MHYDYHLPPRSVIEGRIHYSGSETFKADYFHFLFNLVCIVNLIFLNFHKLQPQSVCLKDTFPHIRSKLCSRLRRVRSLNFLFRYFFFVSRMCFCVFPRELRRGQKKPHWDALADIGWYVLRKISKNPIKPIDYREIEETCSVSHMFRKGNPSGTRWDIKRRHVTIWKESSAVINIQRIIWICSRPPWIYWDLYRVLALFSAAAGRLLSLTKCWKQIAQQETHQTETDRD